MTTTLNQDGACPNCGTRRVGTFCSVCGQNDRNYQRALPPLIWDLLREAFELDSRLLRTLRSLLLRPGELALEFSNNRRASYVSPIRLYLFVSLLFFFLLSLNTELDPGWQARAVLAEEQVAELTGTNAERLSQLMGDTRRAKIEDILTRPENAPTRAALLQLARAVDAREEPLDAFGLFMLSQTVDVLYDPTGAFNQIVDSLPIVVFMLLPVFALLLSLFYRKRRRYYVENLVFAIHLHTVAFLAFSVQLLIPELEADEPLSWLTDLLGTGLVLALAAYHFLALRRYYQEGRVRTLFKFLGQMAVYFTLLVPLVFLLVAAFTLAIV